MHRSHKGFTQRLSGSLFVVTRRSHVAPAPRSPAAPSVSASVCLSGRWGRDPAVAAHLPARRSLSDRRESAGGPPLVRAVTHAAATPDLTSSPAPPRPPPAAAFIVSFFY